MSSIQAGLVAGNKQNEAGGSAPRNRSRFQLSDSFFTTERFADYNPCFVMEGVSGDKITLNQPHQVRTYTLKAPLLQNILKKKDFFMVPMQALLPLNWEKFYTNPTIGDDVPNGTGTGIPNFWGRLLTVFNSDLGTLSSLLGGTGSDVSKLKSYLLFLIYYEMFYSSGSLLKQLRVSGDAYVRLYTTNGDISYDDMFDKAISLMVNTGSSLAGLLYFTITIGGTLYEVECSEGRLNRIGTENSGVPCIGLRDCLELLRDNLDFTIGTVSSPVGGGFFNDIDSYISGIVSVASSASFVPSASGSSPDYHTEGIPLNIARLAAYQICVAHYYSNDHIDVLYSAELYRQYIYSLFRNIFPSSQSLSNNVDTFSYNGIRYLFDSLSGYFFNRIFTESTNNVAGGFTLSFKSVFSKSVAALAYTIALFGFKKSLRFMDYFTGSRTRPLAIGDASVDTSGSSVGVLDISRKFQATRFYNAVNRSGRKFSAYMKEMFGIVPKPDYHNPFYLAHTSDVVGASETENTGVAQMSQANSITTILRSNASRYAFTFEPDRDCVIIGISYYDLPRVYTRATERQNFYLDRMDMFNPFMQFIGDQQIYNAELGSSSPSLAPFSYTNRDMEYKQRFNFGAGGFCVKSTQLGLWFFAADKLRRLFGTSIGSSFIRSFNTEFDQFYVSLTGYSLGTYFHFIVRYDDRCDASRPMAYAPGIMQ